MHFPSWEVGLVHVIQPTTFRVLDFIAQCAKFYNLDTCSMFSNRGELEKI